MAVRKARQNTAFVVLPGLCKKNDFKFMSYIFKKGIVPMWEDNMNKEGGKLTVLLTFNYSNLIWEEVTFNFCKGLLPFYGYINGIVISARQKFLILSFWIKTKNNHIVEKIRFALGNLLQTPSSNCFDFIAFN